MKLYVNKVAITLSLMFSVCIFAHSRSSDHAKSETLGAIVSERFIQVAAAQQNHDGRMIYYCFDFEDNTFRICHRDVIEQLIRLPDTLDLVAATEDHLYCFDRVTNAYIECENIQSNDYAHTNHVNVPVGFELVGASRARFHSTVFYSK